MVRNIRHKGLRLYYEEGNGSLLPADQLGKLSRLLSALNAISAESDIRALVINDNRQLPVDFPLGGA